MKSTILFSVISSILVTCKSVTATPIKACSGGTILTVTSTYSTVPTPASLTSSPLTTATPEFSITPKVLIISNTFEFGYLDTYNWTTQYTGALFTELFACTADAQICKLACGQELVSASQITALLLIPGINLTKTYIIIISGTGGALRAIYQYEAARRAPFLARCDTVSSQIYWHGDVAGENVEYYTNIITTGKAVPCNTNQDDQGRVLALMLGAVYKKIDFTRIAMIKAFSNFDRPPPQLSAYQSRFLIGEGATEPGLRNTWKTIDAVVDDVMTNWDTIFEEGIVPNTYYGDLKESLGGKSDFGTTAGAASGSVQGS